MCGESSRGKFSDIVDAAVQLLRAALWMCSVEVTFGASTVAQLFLALFLVPWTCGDPLGRSQNALLSRCFSRWPPLAGFVVARAPLTVSLSHA